MTIHDFIRKLPKAELHLHIEGSLEPELMLDLAKRNKVKTRFTDVAELREAYNFKNLQEFLDLYYEGASVLIEEQDFYDMTWAYLQRIKLDNVVHTEIFFDPQTHTERGIAFETVVNGIRKALADGQNTLGISSKLIMCFVRHLDESAAMKALEQALPFKSWIIGVGLDSSEMGNPPSKFQNVFKKARAHGFITVAHAGEEGPSAYVWEALNLLKVSRIDHGNRALDDVALVEKLKQLHMPLTVCPLSNQKLQVVPDLTNHPIRKMLQLGLMATVNSDDPAYFGGYVNDNYIAVADALNLTHQEIVTLVKNSFSASFLDELQKRNMIEKVEEFAAKHAQ